MPEVQETDVEQVMERIRQGIRRHRQTTEHRLPESPAPGPDRAPEGDEGGRFDVVAAEIDRLDSTAAIQHVALTSHRRILGPLVVAVKRLLRTLLTPILEAQSAHNAAGVRVIASLRGWIEALDHRHREALGAVNERLDRHEGRMVDKAELRAAQAELQAAQAELRAAHAETLRTAHAETLRAAQAEALRIVREELAAYARAHEGAVRRHSEAIETVQQSLTDAGHRIAGAERKIRRIVHALQPGERPDGPTPAGAGTPPLPREDLQPAFDYAGFEDRFRGSEAHIKARQRAYLPYFEGRSNVLDLGCGRGEFLELLREHGVEARGLDLDLDMVLLCRDKHLDVVREDALAYLGTLADDSVGGIFAAQVIEHLEADRIIELVKLGHRKLAPGGALVLETPNPACLMVFADSFYRDFSHVRPIHPETMKFLLEATGFREVALRFLAAADAMKIPRLEAPDVDVEGFNQGIDRLNALLFGFQDYAVIGRKA